MIVELFNSMRMIVIILCWKRDHLVKVCFWSKSWPKYENRVNYRDVDSDSGEGFPVDKANQERYRPNVKNSFESNTIAYSNYKSRPDNFIAELLYRWWLTLVLSLSSAKLCVF